MPPVSAPILAIDPGAGGGLAVRRADGETVAFPMPESMTAQIDALRSLAMIPNLRAVVEKVGFHRPGNSATSTATFARHVGHLEAAIYCLGVPVEQVAPGVWQKYLGELPKDKAERKRAIREEMARRHPHLSVTLKTADALGILAWATRI
jgi:hypothetical protein